MVQVNRQTPVELEFTNSVFTHFIFFRGMTMSVMNHDDILQDPLRGESFRLSSYISSGFGSVRSRQSFQAAGPNEFTISCTLY